MEDHPIEEKRHVLRSQLYLGPQVMGGSQAIWALGCTCQKSQLIWQFTSLRWRQASVAWNVMLIVNTLEERHAKSSIFHPCSVSPTEAMRTHSDSFSVALFSKHVLVKFQPLHISDNFQHVQCAPALVSYRDIPCPFFTLHVLHYLMQRWRKSNILHKVFRILLSSPMHAIWQDCKAVQPDANEWLARHQHNQAWKAATELAPPAACS